MKLIIEENSSPRTLLPGAGRGRGVSLIVRDANYRFDVVGLFDKFNSLYDIC